MADVFFQLIGKKNTNMILNDNKIERFDDFNMIALLPKGSETICSFDDIEAGYHSRECFYKHISIYKCKNKFIIHHIDSETTDSDADLFYANIKYHFNNMTNFIKKTITVYNQITIYDSAQEIYDILKTFTERPDNILANVFKYALHTNNIEFKYEFIKRFNIKDIDALRNIFNNKDDLINYIKID